MQLNTPNWITGLLGRELYELGYSWMSSPGNFLSIKATNHLGCVGRNIPKAEFTGFYERCFFVLVKTGKNPQKSQIESGYLFSVGCKTVFITPVVGKNHEIVFSSYSTIHSFSTMAKTTEQIFPLWQKNLD